MIDWLVQSIVCKGEEHREGEELREGEEHREEEGTDWLVQSIAWGGA